MVKLIWYASEEAAKRMAVVASSPDLLAKYSISAAEAEEILVALKAGGDCSGLPLKLKSVVGGELEAAAGRVKSASHRKALFEAANYLTNVGM